MNKFDNPSGPALARTKEWCYRTQLKTLGKILSVERLVQATALLNVRETRNLQCEV
jgi:hypothetical protein